MAFFPIRYMSKSILIRELRKIRNRSKATESVKAFFYSLEKVINNNQCFSINKPKIKFDDILRSQQNEFSLSLKIELNRQYPFVDNNA